MITDYSFHGTFFATPKVLRATRDHTLSSKFVQVEDGTFEGHDPQLCGRRDNVDCLLICTITSYPVEYKNDKNMSNVFESEL